ncbi:hypothetical protein ACP8Y2_01675 [Herpetosiphon llansteffanensis]
MQKLYRMVLFGVLIGLLSNCQAQQPTPTAVSQVSPTLPSAAQPSPSQPIATPTQALSMPANERVLMKITRPGTQIDKHYAWLTTTGTLTAQRLYEPWLVSAIPNTSTIICFKYETLCLFDLEENKVVWEVAAPDLLGSLDPFVTLDQDGQGVYIVYGRRGKILDLPMGWLHVRLSDGIVLEQIILTKVSTIRSGWLSSTGDFWFQPHNSDQLWLYEPRNHNLTLASVEGLVTSSQQRLFVLANRQTVIELNALDGMPIRTIELSPALALDPFSIMVAPNLDQVAFGYEYPPHNHWQMYSLKTGQLLEDYHSGLGINLVPSYQAGYWYTYEMRTEMTNFVYLWHPATQQHTWLDLDQSYGEGIGRLWLWPEQPILAATLPIAKPPSTQQVLPSQPAYQMALLAEEWSSTYSIYSTVLSDQQIEKLNIRLLIKRPNLPALVLYGDDRSDALWLYDPQTQTQRHIDFMGVDDDFGYSTNNVIAPDLQQALIVVNAFYMSPARLLHLDLTTNQLTMFDTTFKLNDYRKIQLLAWSGKTLYALLHDDTTSAFAKKSFFAKITLNQEAEIELLAELLYEPQTWISANQQTLVYRQSQSTTEQQLVWWNLTNQTSSTLSLPLSSDHALALAPDGSSLAAVTVDSAQGVAQLRRYDHASQTWHVLDQQPSGPMVTTSPIVGWSADGRRLWWQHSLQQPVLGKQYRVYAASGALQWTDELPLHNHAVVSADAETLVLIGVAGNMIQQRVNGQIIAQFPLPAELLSQRALTAFER